MAPSFSTIREDDPRKLELAVIADDLTGAADTGVQFRPALGPVYLVDHRFLSAVVFEPPPRALSIFTASRSLPRAEAHRAVSVACRVLGSLAPRRIYKKVDSALRGNIGAELEAVMAALNIELSFIAPAFVEQGRTTLGGVHCIHGTPVSETEMRRDPLTPVCESRLSDWIGRQTRFPISHIDLEVLKGGLDAAAGAIDCAVSQGVRHFTFDAAVVEHLDGIARLALDRFPRALLCGSAGLARSLSRALGAGRVPAPCDRRPPNAPRAGHWLFVCGSASERLRLQVRMLADRAGVGVEILEPGCLTTDGPRDDRAAAVQRAAGRLAIGDLILSLSPPSPDPTSIDPDRLIAGVADVVGAVAAAARPGGLFLSGGDTARAVLERLDARAIRLECEPGSGLVYGILMGGPLEGVPVVTKAGSFGPPDALLALKTALSAVPG